MKNSFYKFIIRYKDPSANDPMSRLANVIFSDRRFPKHTDNFNEISDYMEKNDNYSSFMTTFDDAWRLYERHSN